jgi:hypothetical protein
MGAELNFRILVKCNVFILFRIFFCIGEHFVPLWFNQLSADLHPTALERACKNGQSEQSRKRVLAR